MRAAIAFCAGLVLAAPLWAEDVSEKKLRNAVEKGLQRVEAGVANYPKHRQCFSCHHQAMAVSTMAEARQHGFIVDEELFKTQIEFSRKTFRNRTTISQGKGVGGDSTGVVYILRTFSAAEVAYDDTIAALVEYLLVKQSKDGSWAIAAFGERPPTMGSLFTNVGLALDVLQRYRPPSEVRGTETIQKRIDEARKKALSWLLANQPSSNEDRVFHLHGLVAGSAETTTIATAREKLMKEQLKDGSWAQLPRMSGDAYATATALVALRRSGLEAKHEAYQKGVKYLLETQRTDGSWIVQTRSKPLQVYFDNGDAGGKSQFISFAATNWALVALMEAIPERERKVGRLKNTGR